MNLKLFLIIFFLVIFYSPGATLNVRAVNQSKKINFKFDFGGGKVARGYTQISQTSVYNKESGYGFEDVTSVSCIERNRKDDLRGDFCTSDKPFLFSVALPEGNYNVTLILGDSTGESTTTVKSESRRLMLERVATKNGEFAIRSFTVNIRNSKITNSEEVKLKEREIGVFHWDDKLTLEFNGKRPCVAALEITKTDDAITVYLAGDSTVTDQTKEPWAAWGQMLPRFFKKGIAIANHAESGETLKAFRSEKRLDKILSQIKTGDYLFIQFAHNDQKQGSSHVEPFTTYKEQLKFYISEARKRGAFPVLVTSMHRRTFDENGKITNSLLDYPDAMRQTAVEEKVPLIDLNAMSKTFYEALGPEKSIKAFVHYPANTFPDQPQALQDNTHFNAYGAYELARCIVEGIKTNKLPIAKFLVDDVKSFDPAHPDDVDKWSIPASPFVKFEKPAGS